PVPRERDRVPAGDGGARSLPQALPCLRRAGAAHSLRRERGELLPPLPDGWKNTRRPLHVAAPQEGLAAVVGGVGVKVRGERRGGIGKPCLVPCGCWFRWGRREHRAV